jgi:uncharacterized membrane protein YgcG
MDRRTSTQRRSAVIFITCVVIISLVAVTIGTIPVDGFLWNVDKIDSVSVGQNENQTIRGIKVYSEDDPVKINVGSLVNAGAEFDERYISYDLENGQTANDSEVYIKNPNTTDATVVVRSSALDNTSTFDVEIKNINTTRVSSYNQDLANLNNEFKYTTTQAGESDQTSFTIQKSGSVDFTSQPYNNESNKLYFKNVSFVNSSENEVVVWKRAPDGELEKRIATAQKNQSSISLSNGTINGKEEIAITVQPEWIDTPEIIYAADHTTVTAPTSTKLLEDPIYYPRNSQRNQQYSGSVYFEFNTDIKESQGHIDISYVNGPTSRISIENQSDEVIVSDNELYLFPDSLDSSENKKYIQHVTIDGVRSVYGGEDLSEEQYNPKRVRDYILESTATTAARGAVMVISSNKSENISLYSDSRSVNLSRSGDRNYNKILRTSIIPSGEYTLRSESETNGSQINITETSLSPNVPTTIESTGIKIGFQQSPIDREITVSVQNSNNKSVSENVVGLSKNEKESVSIEVSEIGEYLLQIEDSYSGETASRSVEVLNDRDSKIIFDTDPFNSDLGTRYRIGISSSYNDSTIVLIDNSTDRRLLTANLSTPDPGRTEIGINTYALGNESLTGNVVTAGPNATVESVDTSLPNGTLPPGTYRVAVRSEQGLADTADEATVTVGNRSTNGMRVYATTAIDPGSLETAQTVRQAIADGTLSPTETVGPDETVVYAVNATGLTGLPAARNATIETGDDLARFDGFAFDVQSSTATDAETEANESVPDDSSVHLDESGLFLVSDGSDALATDETPTDGETATAEFRVVDEQLREATSASTIGHEVSATLTFEAAELSEDDGATADGGSLDEGGGSGGGSSGGEIGGGASGGGGSVDQSTGGTSGTTTATGSDTSTGPAADGAHSRSDDRDRIGFGRVSGRFEIRPAADVRTVAGRESAASPTVVSVSTPPTRTGSDQLGGDTGPSGENSPSGDARTAEQAADGDRSSSAESAAGVSQTTDQSDESATPKDTTTVEPPTPSYDDAPIRATAEDVPGFGPLVTVLALVLTGRLGARRRDT